MNQERTDKVATDEGMSKSNDRQRRTAGEIDLALASMARSGASTGDHDEDWRQK